MIEKEEFIKKNARSGIIACSIIAALSVIGFTCIVIFDSDKSDITVFVLVLGILLATCIFGIIKFSKQYKEPWKVMPQQTSVNRFARDSIMLNGIGMLLRQIIEFSIISRELLQIRILRLYGSTVPLKSHIFLRGL